MTIEEFNKKWNAVGYVLNKTVLGYVLKEVSKCGNSKTLSAADLEGNVKEIMTNHKYKDVMIDFCNVMRSYEQQKIKEMLKGIKPMTTEEKIKLIKAEDDGKVIEQYYMRKCEYSIKPKGEWNFDEYQYRVKPFEPIPATEDELEYIKGLVFDILNIHIPLKTNSEIEILVRKEKATNMIDISIGIDCFTTTWYVFNPVSKCWEDWGNE